MFEKIFEKYPFFRVIPGVLMMAILFRLSASPSTGAGWLVPPFDKIAHGTAYAVLAFCLSLWWNQAKWLKKKWLWFVVTLAIASLYGVSDEFHQSFVPGRCMDVFDWVADTIGALVGVSAYCVALAKIAKKDNLSL